MKNHFKLFPIVFLLICLSISLFPDTWIQSTKTEFNLGDFQGTRAVNATGTDGDLHLATTIFNGRFDEDGGSYDGWTDVSYGDGIIVNEIVDAAGRTSISYNYATYGSAHTWAKQSQWLIDDLENLNRFHLEVYPISSQCTGTYKLKVRIDALDENENSLIETDDPYDVIEYIFYGTASATSTFDWHDQTTADTWNYFTWNLKNHIQYFLVDPYTWSDVEYVVLDFESYSGYTSGSTCGAYWDAFWAAGFIDDDFDDNYLTPSNWIEHDRGTHGSQIYVAEQNQELRFHGTSHLSYWHWTYVKTQELITHADHRYTESSIQLRLPDFNATNSVFMFMFESDDEQDHFRLFVQPTYGYKYGWRENGNWNSSSQYFPLIGIEDETFVSWRIIYDSEDEIVYGLINGTFIGMRNIPLGDYRIKLCYDIEYAGAYADIRIEDFAFLKYDQGEFETKYTDIGTFISSAHDTGYEIPQGAGFEQISWNNSGETVKFQLRSAETSEDLESATWYGPENNPSGWYETTYPINPVHNNDRWIQYKTQLTTSDQTITPSLHDVALTYHDAVGITFTFENAELTGEGNFFEFDIMAYATEEGTKHGQLRTFLNYNPLGFGENIIESGFAEIGKGVLLDGEVPGFPGEPLYMLDSSDETHSRVLTRIDLNPLALPTDANDLPTTPAQLLHVAILIQDDEQTAGLSFDFTQMEDRQKYSDMITTYSPVVASDLEDAFLSCVPQTVKIMIMSLLDEDIVRISWSEVPGAESYNVYSAYDVYEEMPWFLEESGLITNSWSEPVAGEIKFYYVTAVCE